MHQHTYIKPQSAIGTKKKKTQESHEQVKAEEGLKNKKILWW